MTENHVSPAVKSYELVTEELVKEALRNDKGENAELLSFTIKDFVNKGDNYATVVTSVELKYRDGVDEYHESYVAKLNPLRPQSAFTEMMNQVFVHETEILSDVIGGMNKCLEKLSQPPIKTPKLFCKNLETGREGFLTENLRNLGFIMHDRKKGMDLNHANLVMGELGRYHASSLLLEEFLSPRTFQDVFNSFDIPFLDPNDSAFKGFAVLIKTQAANAAKFLKTLPKYERCVKWLDANLQNIALNYVEGITKSKKPFDVLIHGDCWTNNMLFKYDKNGLPVDIRFVDLQISGKASPACDILYYFYASLSGNLRSENFQRLLYTYYQSFSKILIFARKKVPFTFRQLEEEVENKLVFGFTCGLFLLPGVLAEGDEMMDFDNFNDDKLDEFSESFEKKFSLISQREGPFKDRFLALFDDMLRSNILDEE